MFNNLYTNYTILQYLVIYLVIYLIYVICFVVPQTNGIIVLLLYEFKWCKNIVHVRMLGRFSRPAHITTTNVRASKSGQSFLPDLYLPRLK